MAPAFVATDDGATPEITGARAPAQECRPDELFRGFGAPVAKSLALLSVSAQPELPLWTEVVLLGAGVGPEPSNVLAVVPKPTKSTIVAPLAGVDAAKAVVLLHSTTLPAVADMLMLPITSGVGRFTVPAAPAASWTRKYAPG